MHRERSKKKKWNLEKNGKRRNWKNAWKTLLSILSNLKNLSKRKQRREREGKVGTFIILSICSRKKIVKQRKKLENFVFENERDFHCLFRGLMLINAFSLFPSLEVFFSLFSFSNCRLKLIIWLGGKIPNFHCYNKTGNQFFRVPHLDTTTSFVIQALNGFHLINFLKQSFAS